MNDTFCKQAIFNHEIANISPRTKVPFEQASEALPKLV